MPSNQLSPSPNTTLVILLGASEWPYYATFQPSPAFANAAQRLKAYLLSVEHFALPPENLLDLFDSPEVADEQDSAIGQFLEQRLEALKIVGQEVRDVIVYFVGHGSFVGRDSDFYLAIRRTRESNPRISGINIAALADTLLEKTRHLRHLIILDCCFAAAAFHAFQADPAQVAITKTLDIFRVKKRVIGFPKKGITLLCSSDHKTPSLLLPDESSTMFSWALLEALSRGDPDQQAYLSLREVMEITADLLHEMPGNAPRPALHSPDQSQGDIADIPFFPNSMKKEEKKANSRQAETLSDSGATIQSRKSEPSSIKSDLNNGTTVDGSLHQNLSGNGSQQDVREGNERILQQYPPDQPLKICIFYAPHRQDEKICEKIEAHLSPLYRTGIAESFHYRKVTPGEDASYVYRKNLKEAAVILLLLSADFLDSDETYDLGLRAVQRHEAGEAQVYSVLLRPVDLSLTPFANLPVLLKNNRPISAWKNREVAYADIAKAVGEAVKELRNLAR